MGRMALEGMMHHLGNNESALHWHLAYNCYPPAGSMLEPAREAIELCRAGDSEVPVQLGEGASYQGQPSAPARAIVEGFHLEPFVREEP